MIDVRAIEVEGSPSQAIRITLRNGFTYLMMMIARPINKFVGHGGFEKFLREQTIRSGNISTIRLTLIMEKQQMKLIPELVAYIRSNNEEKVPP